MASSTGELRSRPRRELSTGDLIGIWLLTTVVASLAIGARATYGAQVTSDEPQYLLTALSLGEDLDLDISDELADERFRDFHEVSLNPQTIELDGDGQRLSPHDPLLPILLAPAMRLGGWVGAKLLLAAIAGTTAALTAWLAVRHLAVSRVTALVVTGGLFASPPLTAYGTQVYPEMPAALVVLAGVAGLLGLADDQARLPGATRAERGGRPAGLQALVVVATVALPWLSVKYVPVAAVLAVALVWPDLVAGRRRRALATGAALGAAGLAYLVIHQRIYGGWTVYAAGDHFVDGEFDVVGVDPDYLGRSRRLLGLLVDQRFGLVPWTPAYLLLVPAVAALARRRSGPRLLLTSLLAVGWAVATWVALTMHGWWWPGRQVVVVLPIGVLAVASLVDGRKRLLALTAAASVASIVSWLWLVIEASTDRRTIVVDFFETSAPLYRLVAPAFPDMTVNGATDQLLVALWLLAAVGGAVIGWRTAGPTTPGSDRAGAGPDRGQLAAALRSSDAAVDEER